MQKEPDYSKYSLDALYDVQDKINKKKYPDRYNVICEEIKKRLIDDFDDDKIEIDTFDNRKYYIISKGECKSFHELMYEYKQSGSDTVCTRVLSDRIIFFQKRNPRIEILFENIRSIHLDIPFPATGNIYSCIVESCNDKSIGFSTEQSVPFFKKRNNEKAYRDFTLGIHKKLITNEFSEFIDFTHGSNWDFWTGIVMSVIALFMLPIFIISIPNPVGMVCLLIVLMGLHRCYQFIFVKGKKRNYMANRIPFRLLPPLTK